MPLFGRSKSVKDITETLVECLEGLDNPNQTEKQAKKSLDEISHCLLQIKELLLNRHLHEKNSDLFKMEVNRIQEDLEEISKKILINDGLKNLITKLNIIDFESSKCAVELFGYLCHGSVSVINQIAVYIQQRIDILYELLNGYNKSETALQYGTMLREVIHHECLAKSFLYSDNMYQLFNFVQDNAFDISSDAFSTFRDLLTRHKSVVAGFLDVNYETFFGKYSALLQSDNYVTKRQSLKLLGELLLERLNVAVMDRYVSDEENLKLIMNLMRSAEKQLSFEAFHCFKVFVAHINKPRSIQLILLQNQEKLIDFLTNFQNDRIDEVQFLEEKTYLINQIRDIKLKHSQIEMDSEISK